MSEAHRLAVDSGGTTASFCLYSDPKTITREQRVTGANYNSTGREGLTGLIKRLSQNVGDQHVSAVGLAMVVLGGRPNALHWPHFISRSANDSTIVILIVGVLTTLAPVAVAPKELALIPPLKLLVPV